MYSSTELYEDKKTNPHWLLLLTAPSLSFQQLYYPSKQLLLTVRFVFFETAFFMHTYIVLKKQLKIFFLHFAFFS